ncbi:MAG TPA: histidine phosphatase family protein, partial [Candidatus Baltobacteraceae bacterium]|nr:histidine phosphatase family protein [Candidatus Baltobacteraceae bacterium]
RHGIAVERGTPGFENDAARPLTPKGKRQLRKIAAAIKKMDLRLDLILSSPFLRAKQTAEIAAAGLKLKKRLKFSDELQPDGSFKKLFLQIGEMKPAPENILLTGHEPYLGRMISLLVSGGENMAVDFKKGGLCKLEAEKLRNGKCATLAWLLTPNQMKRMA